MACAMSFVGVYQFSKQSHWKVVQLVGKLTEADLWNGWLTLGNDCPWTLTSPRRESRPCA